MCLMSLVVKSKWKKFTPTAQYLAVVEDIKTINQLDTFMDKIKYVSEKVDKWDTPEEVILNGSCDCDGYARLAMDILERVQNRKDVRFVYYEGYYMEDGKQKRSAHAVAVFTYLGKLAVFDNNRLMINKDSYEDIGHIFYPKGLKYVTIINSKGKIVSSRHLWFGTF